jgi:dipeptidase E
MDPPPVHPPRRLRPSIGRERRILALGGHEFSSGQHDRAVRDLIVELAATRAAGRNGRREPGPPRICLLPTASGDPVDQSARFHSAFAECDCVATDLSLFRRGRRPVAMRDVLLSQDLVYVGGGSLVNLLAIWEAHDLGALLRVAWKAGVVLAGQSAGAMCWFEVGITKSWGRPAAAAGLGFLPGALCVHYHSEPERRSAFLAAVGRGTLGGYGLDDHAGLLWEGESLAAALSLRAGAGAYRVRVRDGEVIETHLAARTLRAEAPAAHGDDVRELRRTLRARPGVGRSA